MSELEKTAVSLRFFGDDLDPDEITRRLGCEPTVGVRKGGIWLTAQGREKVAGRGSWRLHVERRSPGDLDAQILELLAKLSADLNVWTELSERFNADVFCGLFMASGNAGLTLNPRTIAAVGERGLMLNFDIYSGDID